jgi:ABC-type thiamin/hydroxymethylpyrimidine transport system permease subunit
MIDQGTPFEEEPLPEALRRDNMSLLTRILCFCALGRPDLEAHWRSLQSEKAFEIVRTKVSSILDNVITTAGILLATSGVFITTNSPLTYFDYSLPAPYFLLFISFMLAMIAVLTSGSSMLCWIYTDRQQTQEVTLFSLYRSHQLTKHQQLKPGGYLVVSYLLSIVIPMFFVVWSLHCFVFAMLIAGFCSQSAACRVLTVFWLVTYVANIGRISIEFMRKYMTSPKSR